MNKYLFGLILTCISGYTLPFSITNTYRHAKKVISTYARPAGIVGLGICFVQRGIRKSIEEPDSHVGKLFIANGVFLVAKGAVETFNAHTAKN